MSKGVNNPQAYFWAKVDVGGKDQCWPWTGAKTPKGYGNVRIDKAYWKAHRYAWQCAHFPIPDGYMVCHACDNPSCCNPGHLFLGNARANYTDMIKKRRANFRKNKAIGERNCNSKLTESSVLAIREAYSQKTANQYELAETYGISQPTVGAIVRRETWRHI